MKHLELCQFVPDSKKGHYESYFVRANHPNKPHAFWVRYTIFSPEGSNNESVGEIWAMYFNGESNEVVAVQETFPINQCQFSGNKYDFRVGENVLTKGHLSGAATLNGHSISWLLNYSGDDSSILLLPDKLYSTTLPKAKSLVTTPNILFDGDLIIDGQKLLVDGWQGSENHNWGRKHTDQYAWGQVAGFDNNSDAFLECSTARIKVGPIWSPWMTIAVLVVNGHRYRFNSILCSLKAKAKYDYFDWNFKTSNGQETLVVNISANKANFAGLSYKNPPKGSHTCLNSKIGSCTVQLTDKFGNVISLITDNRAAFEILTDESNHGVNIVN